MERLDWEEVKISAWQKGKGLYDEKEMGRIAFGIFLERPTLWLQQDDRRHHENRTVRKRDSG